MAKINQEPKITTNEMEEIESEIQGMIEGILVDVFDTSKLVDHNFDSAFSWMNLKRDEMWSLCLSYAKARVGAALAEKDKLVQKNLEKQREEILLEIEDKIMKKFELPEDWQKFDYVKHNIKAVFKRLRQKYLTPQKDE